MIEGGELILERRFQFRRHRAGALGGVGEHGAGAVHAAARLAHFGSGFGELFAHLRVGGGAFLGRRRRGRVRLLGQGVGEGVAELAVARLPLRR